MEPPLRSEIWSLCGKALKDFTVLAMCITLRTLISAMFTRSSMDCAVSLDGSRSIVISNEPDVEKENKKMIEGCHRRIFF